MTVHADVAVPVPLGRAFSYSVPEALAKDLRRGARVLCEFGTRRVVGVVLGLGDPPPDLPPDRIKPILARVDDAPALPEELLDFLLELSEYYFAPIGEVLRLALPAVERARVPEATTLDLLGEAGVRAVGRLVQVATAVPGPRSDELRGRAKDVYEHLLASGPLPVMELGTHFKTARAAVKRLAELGLVELGQTGRAVDPFFAGPTAPDVPPELTDEQTTALTAITSRLEAKTGGAFLLHGVTASGKTEVYVRAVQHALAQGGSAMVLVPEIALTPQLVQRFRARLGDTIAVLHSGLSGNDRQAMWTALRSGALRVAVGARSALFAPPPRLALVCVDEEHDSSFKQEDGVRYHARDMALLRAHRASAVCVLGSATPSLGSIALARSGKLTLLRLSNRAHRAATLPRVEVVDLRRYGPGPTGDRLLSLPLHRALESVLDRKEQAILFLNRRGFSPSLLCEGCGRVAECPNCSVALTLHRARGERLRCHYCDFSTQVLGRCRSCQSERLAQEGSGTERIEVLLRETFPEARVGRLDRDVASGLKSEGVLDKMRARELDILVGTQMVTKGHDLPGVTLVGVLNADAALSMPDFQAAERTFQLLVQVAGRAGRSDSPGVVLIQTRNPDHPAVAAAAQHDVGRFVEAELAARQELSYPPFSRIALVRVDSPNPAAARGVVGTLAAIARRAAPAGVEIIGPAEAPIARIRGRYRFRFMVRAASRSGVRAVLRAVEATRPDFRARVTLDVDPVSML